MTPTTSIEAAALTATGVSLFLVGLNVLMPLLEAVQSWTDVLKSLVS